MILDVYNCEECTRAFGVEKDEEPKCCPHCESELWEFSHSVKGVLIEDHA
jgi:rubrerythrin